MQQKSAIIVTCLLGASTLSAAQTLCNAELPPISATISTREDLDDLIIGLQTANIDGSDVLSIPGEQPVVLLAPTNNAFEVLADALNAPIEGLLSEPSLLNTLLSYHLITSGTCDGQLTGEIGTAHGESVVFLGDGTVQDSNGNVANILEVVESGNGAVVVIDQVLLPLGP